jgi:hypothetical protein
MDYRDFEKFAKEHNIHTIDVDGEFESGYPTTYVYFEPESVIKAFHKTQQQKNNECADEKSRNPFKLEDCGYDKNKHKQGFIV